MKANGKKKKFNIKKAKKELDSSFSKYIRRRDGICQKCRKTPATQAAHIFSRGRLSTRWDEENIIGLCFYCHLYWAHREPVEFTLWIIDRLGEDRFKELQKKSLKVYDSSELRRDYERIKTRFQPDVRTG